MEMVGDMPSCQMSLALGNQDVTTILVDNALTSQSPNVPKGLNIVAKSCHLEVEELEFAILRVEKKKLNTKIKIMCPKKPMIETMMKKISLKFYFQGSHNMC
jgi:hypothetical protein